MITFLHHIYLIGIHEYKTGTLFASLKPDTNAFNIDFTLHLSHG